MYYKAQGTILTILEQSIREKNFAKCMYIKPNHCSVHLKLAQHCKSTTIKKKKYKGVLAAPFQKDPLYAKFDLQTYNG